MLVIDESTGKKVKKEKCTEVVVSCKNGKLIFGYVEDLSKCVSSMYLCKNGERSFYNALYEKTKNDMFFSNRQGIYIFKENLTENYIISETHIKGRGIFPYNFSRRYEAVENFRIFSGKQTVLGNTKYRLSEYLDYTFGLEFETSEGIIPENICYQDGLIPLRDGSITGLEYSTVVMKGNSGLNLLSQQLETLKKYTSFNKECSLHIHFGGYPLEDKALFKLYQVCLCLQENGELSKILPPFTFETSRYKDSGKDYCKFLPKYKNFESLYRSFVGENYLGSLKQPHPNDPDRKRKWNIPTRYYWINFINMFCYTINKTVEFRFLRPTYNLRKILVWMYIMNAILKYSEEGFNIFDGIKLQDIIKTIYPKEVSDELCLEILKLEILVKSQVRNSGDMIGADLSYENDLFPENELI